MSYINYNHKYGVKKLQTKLKLSIKTTVASLAAIGLVTAIPLAASASSGNSPSASYWHIGYYNPSGRALSEATAGTDSSGNPVLNFTNEPNTALLITDQKSKNGNLLGDMQGKTITATFTVSGADSSDFNFYGENGSSGSGSADVRLYFERKSGPFAYTNYWWADAAFTDLGNGNYSLTATIDPSASWSDWNGQPSNTNVTAFNNASSNITGIGLSFGGGYFFENGVGTVDGSGTLNLTSFTAQ